LCAFGGCNAKTDKKAEEATITRVDPKKRIVDVKMPSDGKDVEKTFKLDENIEYVDNTGKVASADIFNSGDDVLIVESEGTISQMKKKGNAEAATKPDVKNTTSDGGKTADQTFIQTADQIDMAEVKIGKVAEENAMSDAVKTFGKRMVSDHSRMNKELREITTKNRIELAEGLDPKHQQLLATLSKLKGAEFDRVYAKDMVSGHEKAIEQFEAEAKNGQDPDVKAWAEKCLPTLREHLALAQDAAKAVNGGVTLNK
jgi:putative membrane protein